MDFRTEEKRCPGAARERTKDQRAKLTGEIESAVRDACRKYQVKLPQIRWSGRMTASAGKASKREVVFSIPLFLVATDSMCMETAYHEAAHYIDFQLRGTSDHGPAWRRIMAAFGYPNAARCHSIDRSLLYRYEVLCDECDEVLVRYTRRPTRTLKRKRSACCGSRLRLVACR